jgi:diguanylate cyclase (GGDEF)-like protein
MPDPADDEDMRGRVSVRRLAVLVLTAGFAALLLLHLADVVLGGAVPEAEPVTGAVTGAAAFVVGALLAAARWADARPPAPDGLVVAALACYAGAWQHRLFAPQPTGVDDPVVGDLLWAPFPVLVVAALVGHGLARRARATDWVDLAIGAAGGAAFVAAFVLAGEDWDGTGPASSAVNAAYVVGESAIVVAALSVTAVRRRRLGRAFWLLASGAVTLVGTDGAYLALRAGSVTDPAEGPLRLGWMLGLSLVVLSVGARRPAADPTASRPRPPVIVVPLVGALVSVVVLLGTSDGEQVVRWTAALAVVLAVARMAMAFREVAALAGSRELALTDELTGLANRRAFYRAGERRSGRGTPCALVLLDLDGFKQVNDGHGHGAGDELLRLVAGRLHGVVREDRGGREGDLVARLGGDEFAVLVAGREHEASLVAERAVAALEEPFDLGGVVVRVSAAAGVAAVDDGVALDELVRRADVAMYRSKAEGAGVVVHTAGLDRACGGTPVGA